MRSSLLFIALLINFPLVAQQKVLTLSTQPDWNRPLDISPYTSFYEVENADYLAIDEVNLKRFEPFNEKLNKRARGNRNPTDITWLRFSLKNDGVDTLQLLLNCNVHHSIRVFQDNRLIAQSGFLNGNFALASLTVAPGAQHTYSIEVVDIVVAVLPLVAELHTERTYLLGENKALQNVIPLTILMALWSGCFIFMAGYSAYRFYLNRDYVFLYYAVFSFSLFWVCMFALSSRLALHWIPYGFTFLLFPAYSLFISQITDLKHTNKVAWKVLQILMIVCAAQEIVAFADRYNGYRPIIPFVAYYDYQFASGLLVIIVCFVAVMRSSSPIKTYLICGILSMIFIGLLPIILNPYFSKEADEWEAIINYPFSFAFAGFAVENFCFALALAYRARLVEREKDDLQRGYSDTLERELAHQAVEIRNTTQQLQERTISELTASYEQRLLQMETSALRAQMNPHFIFNCLNSIKLYTLENDSVSAADYLTRFSRLIRLVLENSAAEKVPLQTELDTLQLYADMEAMRFKNKFSFSIRVHPNVDVEFIDIPPMLLQPYVENAIWHGLMHKGEHGSVEVIVNMHAPQLLQVEIIDDGIGRARAAEYKTKSATQKKSFGMKMNAERIALINQQSRNTLFVQVEDLVAANGDAAGTRVSVLIPV